MHLNLGHSRLNVSKNEFDFTLHALQITSLSYWRLFDLIVFGVVC